MMQVMTASDRSNAEVYREHAAELVRYATVLVGPTDAADVVADAVLGAFGSRVWPTVTNRRAYLYRAVYPRALDLRRGAARRHRREAVTASSDSVVGAEPSLDAQRALDHLPAQQRAVVFLTYWADLTPAQAAELLDVSEGTVRKQLARARTTLRRVLDVD
jgi:RNA polymerase sigma-70 factor (ECF subfamily)